MYDFWGMKEGFTAGELADGVVREPRSKAIAHQTFVFFRLSERDAKNGIVRKIR